MTQRKARTSSSEPMAEALARTMQRLDELSRLERDWDSYGGLPPSEVAIATARRLISAVATRVTPGGANVEPFFTAPVPTGGVQFEWAQPGVELEIEIGPTGSLSVLLARSTCDAENVVEERDVAWSRVVDLISETVSD
jgi:hypothetical protein